MRHKPIVLHGTYGSLTVVELRAGKRKDSYLHKCMCECGKECLVSDSSIKRGTKSCGCLTIQAITKHGMDGTKIYSIWRNMVHRCTCPTAKAYPRYGGRGIRVCNRWRDFKNFMTDIGPRPDGGTLDRLNNDGNYEPDNCRWRSMAVQNRNKCNNRVFVLGGKHVTLAELLERYGVPRSTVFNRLARGLSISQALGLF